METKKNAKDRQQETKWIRRLARIAQEKSPSHFKSIERYIRMNPYFISKGYKEWGIPARLLSKEDAQDLAFIEVLRTKYPGTLGSSYIKNRWGETRKTEQFIDDKISRLPIGTQEEVYRQINLRKEERAFSPPRLLDEKVIAYEQSQK